MLKVKTHYLTFNRKFGYELPWFLQRIHGDICGPIHPAHGPHIYFMVLVDTFNRWSHVCLLYTRNVAFAWLLAQTIKPHANFLDYLIKNIRTNNVVEFTSKIFNEFCSALGIMLNIQQHMFTLRTDWQNRLQKGFK